MSLLTTKEAADFLKLSPRTLEKYRVLGRGPAFVTLGRARRYRIEDLERWVSGNIARSTAEVVVRHEA
jgi:excisionase family DNA binding protein